MDFFDIDSSYLFMSANPDPTDGSYNPDNLDPDWDDDDETSGEVSETDEDYADDPGDDI